MCKVATLRKIIDKSKLTDYELALSDEILNNNENGEISGEQGLLLAVVANVASIREQAATTDKKINELGKATEENRQDSLAWRAATSAELKSVKTAGIIAIIIGTVAITVALLIGLRPSVQNITGNTGSNVDASSAVETKIGL